MSMLDLDLGDAAEPIVVEANKEYKLRIISVRKGKDKNSNPYIMPRFDIPEESDAKDFTNFIPLPSENLEEKRLKRVKWALKNFLEAFGIDHTKPFDPEDDLIGAEGWAILGMSEDEQYGEQNYVKKFIAPK